VDRYAASWKHSARISTVDHVCFSGSSWFQGANNLYPSNTQAISSFDAIDQVLQWFASSSNFPNLNEIVLAGHSMGAQMIQRYAVVAKPLNLRGIVALRLYTSYI
jgi:pimeloyl-ACP methyl ester carboxylesterase